MDKILDLEIQKVNANRRKINDLNSKFEFWKGLSNIEPMAKEFTDCINANLNKHPDLEQKEIKQVGDKLIEYAQQLIFK